MFGRNLYAYKKLEPSVGKALWGNEGGGVEARAEGGVAAKGGGYRVTSAGRS